MLCLEHIDIKDLFEKRKMLLGRFPACLEYATLDELHQDGIPRPGIVVLFTVCGDLQADEPVAPRPDSSTALNRGADTAGLPFPEPKLRIEAESNTDVDHKLREVLALFPEVHDVCTTGSIPFEEDAPPVAVALWIFVDATSQQKGTDYLPM